MGPTAEPAGNSSTTIRNGTGNETTPAPIVSTTPATTSEPLRTSSTTIRSGSGIEVTTNRVLTTHVQEATTTDTGAVLSAAQRLLIGNSIALAVALTPLLFIVNVV